MLFAFFGLVLRMLNPRNSIRSPSPRARFMLSKTVSTTVSALVLVIPALVATSLMISSLLKVRPLALLYFNRRTVDHAITPSRHHSHHQS